MTNHTEHLPKISSHIPGLDKILHGGLASGRNTLIIGGPGTGKSMMGLQSLYYGALNGSPGIFVTFEERADMVRQNALTLGWDLAGLEKENRFFLIECLLKPDVVVSGDFSIQGLLTIIEAKSRSMGASRIVLDAVDGLLRYYGDIQRERNELYAFNEWMADHRDLTAIITVKASAIKEKGRYDFLEYMFDCIINLEYRAECQIARRYIGVKKYRGSDFIGGGHPFIIKSRGISLMPVYEPELGYPLLGEVVSFGHSELDAIMGGGFRRGSAVLIAGETGTGKTTVVCTFVQAAGQRGEKTLYINFEESTVAVSSTMSGVGIDLNIAADEGLLRFFSAMPESRNANEHLYETLEIMNEFKPDHVVVDAISACMRIGSEEAAHYYMMQVLNVCREKGVTCIFLNQTSGREAVHEISGFGVSSMVDSILYLRYTETAGELNRLMMVVKSRGMKHSNQNREFLITENGIRIVDIYSGEGGLLTGIARKDEETKETNRKQKILQQIKVKKSDLNQKRAALEATTAKYLAEIEVVRLELESMELENKMNEQNRKVRQIMRDPSAGAHQQEVS